MHYKENYLYIGIDPHKDFHVAVVLDIWGNWRKKLAVVKLHNRPSAFPGFLEQVKSYAGKGETLLFGLEDAHNYGRSLAAFLHDNLQPVKEVNSALTTMQRKSNPSIHKDDAWDAFCAAEILRSRLDELPDIKPDDYYWTIRQLVTRRYGLVKSFGTNKNQLHVQLALSYPSYTKMFGAVDGMAALKFWDKYPSPKALEGVTAEGLDKFLRDACRNKRAINGKAEKILSLVQSDGDTTRDHQDRRDFLVRNIVKELWHRQELIAELEKELREVLKLMELKLETMPGISTVTAAALVAEIGDINRFSSADKLARYAGCAPVSFSSGKKIVNKRSQKQGNRRLNEIFYMMAMGQLSPDFTKGKRNPVFYAYYQRKISEGKTKGQALICISRRLVNIVYKMMKYKMGYVIPELPDNDKV